MAAPIVEREIETTWITEDELMALDSYAQVEVIDGEIVEMSPVGGTHHFIGGNVYDFLSAQTRQHNSGYVFMDGLIYLLHKKGNRLKGAQVPDVSYIRKEDISAEWDLDRPVPGAPTLAVEVVSPGDDPEKLLKRVQEYLNAGTAQVIVIFPSPKQIYQYRRADPDNVRVYQGDSALDLSEFFAAASLPLRDVFDIPTLGA